MTSIEEKIKKLQGPILVLGASGFVGANLFRMILKHRRDVFGTYFHSPAWRLEDLPEANVLQTDLLVDSNLDVLLDKVRPKTLFNCAAYGAYSFETDGDLIYQTNFNLAAKVLRRLDSEDTACYVQAGSSSEYGENSSGPAENEPSTPNSDYAVSKASCSSLLYYYGRKKGLPCANLRLYSAYGPMEDASRFIPCLVGAGLEGKYPQLVSPEISRDFVYIDDACEAFLDCALNLQPSQYGESFNIGSGKKTTIEEAAQAASKLFKIKQAPKFQSMPDRKWDVKDWFADARKAKEHLGWEARTPFADGLQFTAKWYGELPDKEKYRKASKQFEIDSRHSVSAVIACYKDAEAVPIMYERLKKTFEKLKVDYEIIFVNDNSPDNCEEIITDLTKRDRHVIGISHSRNFGSQAAFRSGLEIASKNSCVLLDGDLQDPPEVIEPFVEKWREGAEVVYGRRVKREASWLMQIAYKFFYRVFQKLTYFPIPRDAGDFSLIDRRVVKAILQFPERDFFLRGVRAYAGFRQVGVDYLRPKRAFGVTTNNLFKNIAWAKKAILSFSYTPLTVMSYTGTFLFLLGLGLALLHIGLRLFFPDLAPKGLTTVIIVVLFFGSINLFALAILGEYIAKIFEEVKQRPHFIRKSIIKAGEVRSASQNS